MPPDIGFTRDRLLEAALELFATQGFKETSTAQIEEAAGLSPRSGGLYKHFKSKQELLEVALAERMSAITTFPDQLDLGPPGDLRTELRFVARFGLAELAKERPLALLVMKEGHRLPHFRDAFRDSIVRPGRTLAMALLERYAEQHNAEFDDIEALAEVIMSALVGIALQGFMFGRDYTDVPDERLAEAHAEMCVAIVESNARRTK